MSSPLGQNQQRRPGVTPGPALLDALPERSATLLRVASDYRYGPDRPARTGPDRRNPGRRTTLTNNMNPIPITDRLISNPGQFDPALANLLHYFRNGVLLPVGANPDMEPAPLATEWDSPGYQSRLVTNNIAVVLGARSDKLLGIQFADRTHLGEFLMRNPDCRRTLITVHAAGPVVWQQAATNFGAPIDLPGLRVRMTGHLLIYDRTALPGRDFFLNLATITTIDLAAINWGPDPDGRIAAWHAHLAQGEFFRRGGRGQMIPNAQAWRAYLAARLKSRFCYESRERQFYRRVNGNAWQPVPDEQMRDEIRRLTAAAPVGTAEAKSRLTDEFLGRLGSRLKSSLATQLQFAEDRVRAFAEDCLVKGAGANVTNAELAAAFTEYCRQTGQPPLSAKKFRILIGRLLRGERWCRCYSKSVKRPGGDQNGWRGVQLRSGEASIPPATNDGADGAHGAENSGEICIKILPRVAA